MEPSIGNLLTNHWVGDVKKTQLNLIENSYHIVKRLFDLFCLQIRIDIVLVYRFWSRGKFLFTKKVNIVIHLDKLIWANEHLFSFPEELSVTCN